MDEPKPTPPDQDQDKPGAPELSARIKVPSAPLIEDRHTGPVFRGQPTARAEQAAQAPTQPSDEVDEPDDPPMADDPQARLEYLRSLRQDESKRRRKKKGGKKWLVVLLVLLLLAGGAAAAYFVLLKDREPAPAPQPATEQPAVTEPTSTLEEEEETTSAVDTQTYTSQTFDLSLSYPEDWTPEELADQLTITSPVVELTDANGEVISGRIIYTVREQEKKSSAFESGKVLAVLESSKVNYEKPSAIQRGLTYVSYLQYPTATVKGAMNAVYVTGDYGYKYGQVVPRADIAKISPLIHVSFVSCPDETCDSKDQQPLTISSTAWQADETNRPAVETMFTSLTIR